MVRLDNFSRRFGKMENIYDFYISSGQFFCEIALRAYLHAEHVKIKIIEV